MRCRAVMKGMVGRRMTGSARPWSVLWWAASLIVLVSLGSCSASTSPPTPAPDPTSTPNRSISAPPPTPAQTPTASALDPILAGAVKDYIDYSRALDRLSQAGGAEELPEYLSTYLTPDGYARKLLLDETSALKGSGSRWEGETVLRGFELIYAELQGDPLQVDWQVCVDQSGIRVTTGNESSTTLGRRADRVEMHRSSVDGHWQIENIEYSAGPVPNLCEW